MKEGFKAVHSLPNAGLVLAGAARGQLGVVMQANRDAGQTCKVSLTTSKEMYTHAIHA